MNNLWWLNILGALVLSIIFSGFLIPQILLIAFRKKLFDDEGGRKIHKGTVPRLGGIAFKPVIFFSITLIVALNLLFGKDCLNISKEDIITIAFGYCAVVLLYLVGIADDLIGVRYKAKFFVQVLCAVMLVTGGLWLSDFHGLFFLNEIPVWIGYPLTVLVVVFIINAINLIDGIDGLASGLCGVALFAYLVVFCNNGDFFYAMLSSATLGVLIPFFYYNVFGDAAKRKKIFMGDTGALTVGIIVSILSLKLLQDNPSYFEFNPFVVAFSPLIIPCFDVIRVYMRRVRYGKNPFMPDKSHIHHKLLALGFKQRVAMVSIIMVGVFFVFGNILLSRYVNINILLMFDILFVTCTNIWLTWKIRKRNSKEL